MPRANEVLSYELEAVGMKLDTSEDPELPDFNYEYSHNKKIWDVAKIAHTDEDVTIHQTERDEEIVDNVMKALDAIGEQFGNK